MRFSGPPILWNRIVFGTASTITFLLTFISITDIPITDMNALPDDVRGLIPLTPAVFYVMLALSPGPKHGYAIAGDRHPLGGRVPHGSRDSLFDYSASGRARPD